MRFVTGLALSLLSFVLFLSLSVSGAVFTLTNTVLNPDFLIRELDMYSIILAVIGVALLVVSFVYKPRESSL